MSVGNDKLRLLRQIPTIKFEEEMRGYSKAQVDRVLDILAPLADEIEDLQVQVTDATARAEEASHRANAIASSGPQDETGQTHASPDENFDETLRNTLLLAQRTADQTIRDAESKAAETRRESTAKADSIMAGARAEAKELKGEAHAQREQMLADAESERAELLADALEHAETRKSAIEEELLSEQGLRRNELLAEISQLERSRDDLNSDVHRFEQFLEGRRSSVADALEELKAVLDNPDLLAETETPEPAEIGLLDPEELTQLNVESHSIGALSTEVEAAQQQAADFAFTEIEDDEPVYADDIVPEPSSGEFDALDVSDAEVIDTAPETEINTGDSGYSVDGDGEPEFESTSFEPEADEPSALDAPVAEPFDSAETFDSFETSPAEEFAAAIDGDETFPPAEDADPRQEWQPFAGDSLPGQPGEPAAGASEFDTPTYQATAYETPAYEEPPQPFDASPNDAEPIDAHSFETEQFQAEGQPSTDPFATGGYIEEVGDDAGGIAASVTPDSVFSSVPETADPSAYSDLPAPVEQGMSDPAGLGIDVESPFSEQAPEEEHQAGLGGLAEQARNRLASRVSRLRDSAVPEAPDASAQDYPAAPDYPAPDDPQMAVHAPAFDQSLPPAPVVGDEAVTPSFAPPPAPVFGNESTPAFPSDSVGGAEWSAPDPNRPMHPDAHLEDLPAADPFLDELRQRTEGEQPEGDDETLTRFLAEDGEKESGGGWFGRRNK